MRIPRTTTVLCAFAATACLAAPAASALADTGGASASPPTPAPGPAPAHGLSKALATWFGPGFYGQTTACGQLLTPATVGVAHRTLPCGTLVRISYHRHRLVVPVIDRGPYGHNGASFDLTAGAAQALGIEGSARIGARVVGRAANTPALGEPPAPPPGAGAATLAGGAAAAPTG
jgi:rare lipoprotein A (peptidoglycan hydrolase)